VIYLPFPTCQYYREIKYCTKKSINIWLFDGEPLAIYTTINNCVFCARYLFTDYSDNSDYSESIRAKTPRTQPILRELSASKILHNRFSIRLPPCGRGESLIGV